MSRIKRHHTIPCSYLKGFVDHIDEKYYRRSVIEVYDRKNEQYRKQPINDTTVIKDFYTLEDENGNKTDILEKALGQEVDSKIGNIIKKIDNREHLTKEENNNLFLFIAFQKQRTKVDITGYKETEEEMMKYMFLSKYQYGGKEELKNTLEKIGIDTDEKSLEEHYDFLINGEWDININNGFLMKQMLNQIALTYDFLINFNYVIFKAPKNRYFITSDDPYYMNAPMDKRLMGGGVGFLTPGLEIHIPLSKKSCLFMTNGDKMKVSGYYKIPTHFLRSLNKRTCSNSYRYVLGHNKKLIENLVKQTGIKGVGDFKHKISTPLSRSNKK